jgi:hypothetical protein
MSRFIVISVAPSSRLATHRSKTSPAEVFRVIDTTISTVEGNRPRVNSIDHLEPIPVEPKVAKPRELSKLTLKRRLEELGKWDAFKTILQASPAWDDFLLAQVVRTDDPVFTTQAPALKAALGLTDEQFNSLIL